MSKERTIKPEHVKVRTEKHGTFADVVGGEAFIDQQVGVAFNRKAADAAWEESKVGLRRLGEEVVEILEAQGLAPKAVNLLSSKPENYIEIAPSNKRKVLTSEIVKVAHTSDLMPLLQEEVSVTLSGPLAAKLLGEWGDLSLSHPGQFALKRQMVLGPGFEQARRIARAAQSSNLQAIEVLAAHGLWSASVESKTRK